MEWNYCLVSLFWIASGEVNFVDFADDFSFQVSGFNLWMEIKSFNFVKINP
jgi:hypothetical protein